MNQMQIRTIAEQAKETCFLCIWILEDLRLHEKLTDWPPDSNDKGQFPAQGKVRHLELESVSLDRRNTALYK